MNDIEEARELLAVAEAACVKVLGPNVAVITEHIYKALTLAEGNLVAIDTPTETDEEHAERAKAAIEAMQAEVKAGEERQAKAQAAYNAIVAKGGENADIYANKVYAEMLAGADFAVAEEAEADEPKADEVADEAENTEGDSDEPKADEVAEVVEVAKPGKKK